MSEQTLHDTAYALEILLTDVVGMPAMSNFKSVTQASLALARYYAAYRQPTAAEEKR